MNKKSAADYLAWFSNWERDSQNMIKELNKEILSLRKSIYLREQVIWEQNKIIDWLFEIEKSRKSFCKFEKFVAVTNGILLVILTVLLVTTIMDIYLLMNT